MMLLIPSLCSCQQGSERTSLTVVHDPYCAGALSKMVDYAEYLYPNLDIELIELESVDQEVRSAQLTQIRTEIMAGGGPDVFICDTVSPGTYAPTDDTVVKEEALFIDAQKAISNRLFLPLDDYVANSEHIDPDEHHNVIMDAGCLDDTRYVLPLTYTYNVIIVDKNAAPEREYGSLSELIDLCDEPLQIAVRRSAPYWVTDYFGTIVDYENSILKINEDEFVSHIMEWTEETDMYSENYSMLSNSVRMGTEWLYEWNANRDDADILYFPNSTGGITAYITSFIAINANTALPDEAFRFVELFFNETAQKGLSYKETSVNDTSFDLIKVSDGGYGDLGLSTGKYSLESSKFDEIVSELNQKITSVRFYTDIEYMLYEETDMMLYRPMDREATLRELYSELKMIAAE